jgi:hypothetical protein
LPRHEQFEELAAIAAKGELTPAEEQELVLHLADCPRCREAYEEYQELHAPLHPLFHAHMTHAARTDPQGVIDPAMDALIESRREKVKSAVLQAISVKRPQMPVGLPANESPARTVFGWNALRPLWAGLVLATAMSLAFWVGVRYDQHKVRASEQARNVTSAETVRNAALPPANPRTDTQDDARNPSYAQVVTDLRAEKQRAAKLDATLTDKDRELADSENARMQAQQQLDAQSDELRRTQTLLASKTDQLNQMQAAKSSDSTTMAALQYEVQDLTQKLNEQNESLDRERQLLASGRDIRDIVGARNLHIIDVYDTGPEGNTRKSFARAFYTEGKSLIFYAYDLPARNTENGKFVYAAWGEKNGSKKTVRNLGILLNDDKGQRRWVLNFSDPKVLAEIDSVFVTLERTGSDSEQPNGKRMLTAYLDSQVNHP